MEKVIYNLVFNRKKQLNAEGKASVSYTHLTLPTKLEV